MKLIVGLGNPGRAYANTRHNVGFMLLDKFKNDESLKKKFKGLYFKEELNGEQVIFLYPQKFMNRSGEVVKSFVDYFNIEIEDILIVHDDMDLPLGEIRLKQNSGSGGHNGIKDIERHLGTNNYKRLKIGIGSAESDVRDFVLGKFSKAEIDKKDVVISKSKEIVIDFMRMSFIDLMNKYN